MEVSNRGEVEVQAALFKVEVHGEETNVSNLGLNLLLVVKQKFKIEIQRLKYMDGNCVG